MRQKLFNKYFLATTLIVLLSLTVMMMILTFIYNSYLADSKYESLQKTCDTVSEYIGSEFEELDFADDDRGLYYVMSNLAEVSQLDVFVTDENGVICMCGCQKWGNGGNCDHFGTKLPLDFISRLDVSDIRELNDLDFYRNPRYVIAGSVHSKSGEKIGYVIATSSTVLVKSLMLRVGKLYLLAAVVPVVLMFFALYALTYKLTRPLKLMSDAAKAMAKGDFSRRIPVTSDDEIGELAVSFNQMTNSLALLESMRKDFVANISHELKTPMTTIGGFIDGIIDGTIEPEKQNYYLGIVSEEIKRLSRMVQTMLAVSRLESGEFVLKPENFDFRELLISVVFGQEQRIERQELQINGLDSLPSVTVNADKDLIYRVVYNLVDNAIKFNKPQGSIDFSLKVEARKLVFGIKNTGCGIPEKELPYVFERFYKVDKSRSANKKSTGLGLYIVKTIIKNHGGTISVSSVENDFTAFEITLPLSK